MIPDVALLALSVQIDVDDLKALLEVRFDLCIVHLANKLGHGIQCFLGVECVIFARCGS